MNGRPEELIGSILSETYRIDRVVGEGAFGAVYAATHMRLHRPVAVKVLRARDHDAFQRFRREAEITSNLGSRFIAQVFDFNVTADDYPYLVMELLSGEDLGARLYRVHTLELSEALRITEQVAMALSVAHRHHVIHRDLKPQNIFLSVSEDEGEVVKVIDFGISKVLTDAGTTAVGQILGTPLYMSPEQIRGRQQDIDARTDVYALASVLYQAIGGRPAYLAGNMFELAERINGPTMPPPLSSLKPDIPPELDDVMASAMAKNPADRPRTVTDFYNLLSNAIRTKAKAATPAAAIMGTHALETMYATGLVATPLWRGRTKKRPIPDELRFSAPDGGFFGQDFRTRVLTLTRDKNEFTIGSVPVIGDIENDLVVPHRQVSRNSVRVIVRDGRVFVRREPRCSVPVRVGLSLLERGEERPLHHGQAVVIGVVAGVFHDGRYVPAQVPALSVDEQTALLGRDGLAWEVALAARLGDGRNMVLATPIGPAARDERVACRVAEALHDFDPLMPVARFGTYAAAVVTRDADLQGLAAAAQQAASVHATDHPASLLIGYLDVGTSSDEAGARIDEAVGALTRLAGGAQKSGLIGRPIDLGEYRVAIYEPPAFLARVHDLAQSGGEVGLLALQERDRIEQLGAAVLAALELELLQIAGRLASPQTVFCRPAPGCIAFAGPDAAEPIARHVASEWHSRGPVRGEVLEVERSVAIDIPNVLDLGDESELGRRAAELAAGGVLGTGAGSLPLPLAAAARDAASATEPIERAGRLLATVNATWRFLSIVFGSMAVAARRASRSQPFAFSQTPAAQAAPGRDDDAAEFTGPWRQSLLSAARDLAGAPGRVGELASALVGEGGAKLALRRADEVAQKVRKSLGEVPDRTMLSRLLPELERRVATLMSALRPLRGWTLVAVTRVDRVDVFGDCETVEYIDYTGTYERGTPRQVTLIKDLRIGPFVYLSRFAEGIVVPLEPHMRRRMCPETGVEELVWAEAEIRTPGMHHYRTVVGDILIEDEVTSKQIPRT